ncbi:hypothetical protein F5Y19DRAFT_488267 [Xylariaceae sp. FL1651]|nr:hypothetical protein F5Y19DRAFT_488267 [Xylariaceae sp. FL1651]
MKFQAVVASVLFCTYAISAHPGAQREKKLNRMLKVCAHPCMASKLPENWDFYPSTDQLEVCETTPLLAVPAQNSTYNPGNSAGFYVCTTEGLNFANTTNTSVGCMAAAVETKSIVELSWTYNHSHHLNIQDALAALAVIKIPFGDAFSCGRSTLFGTQAGVAAGAYSGTTIDNQRTIVAMADLLAQKLQNYTTHLIRTSQVSLQLCGNDYSPDEVAGIVIDASGLAGAHRVVQSWQKARCASSMDRGRGLSGFYENKVWKVPKIALRSTEKEGDSCASLAERCAKTADMLSSTSLKNQELAELEPNNIKAWLRVARVLSRPRSLPSG